MKDGGHRSPRREAFANAPEPREAFWRHELHKLARMGWAKEKRFDANCANFREWEEGENETRITRINTKKGRLTRILLRTENARGYGGQGREDTKRKKLK